MSNVDSRTSDGVSRFQDSIQQGKQKIQNAQEAAKAKKMISQLSNQKGKLLIDLGQAVYLEYRKGAFQHSEVANRASGIEEVDIAIHDYLVQLKEYSNSPQQTQTCECGTKLSDSDQFCPNCGTKVTKQEEVEQDLKQCHNCQHDIPMDANFCSACGSKA